MSANIPQSVLSDALLNAMRGRHVKAAVFLTFQFDPGFFEEEILPLLFAQSFSHVPKVRLLQLEEALRAVDHIAVYYDRQGLTAGAQPARLDYRRIGLARSTGYFHSKNIFLLVEDEVENGRQSLIFATLSANLTRAGWWENVEIAHLAEIKAEKTCPYRQDLLRLIARIKREDKTGDDHTTLEIIHAFVRDQVVESNRHLPALYHGQDGVPTYLRSYIRPGDFNLEIISPYFDVDAGALEELLDILQPKATRLFLPEGKDGAALCSPEFYQAVEQRSSTVSPVKWGRLSADLLSLGAGSESSGAVRFVHAKMYRFWNQEREILFAGSVNLTSAAHSAANSGNFETAILVDTGRDGRRTWWLEPMEDDMPAVFRPESVEDVEPDATVSDLSFRFDWDTGEFQYLCESRSNPKPEWATISMQGVPIGPIASITFDQWVCLPDEYAEHVKRQLASTSFVEVCADDGMPFRTLVREEHMAYKPSLLLSLTPEEILQYWSLLSPEQRETTVTNKIAAMIGSTDAVDMIGMPLRTKQSTLFDRFAGTFHGFDRLEAHLHEAFSKGRETEAIYRLFGEKYDSLPSLLEQVIEDEGGDRVNRYMQLLCARQLLERVREQCPEFVDRHRAEFRVLKDRLEAVEQIKAGFTFDTPEQREQFFNWFERMFAMKLASAPVKETS